MNRARKSHRIEFSRGFGHLWDETLVAHPNVDLPPAVHDGEYRTAFGARRFTEHGIPFVQVMCIIEGTRIDWLADARDRDVARALNCWRESEEVFVTLAGKPGLTMRIPCMASRIEPCFPADVSMYRPMQNECEFLFLASRIVDSTFMETFDEYPDTITHMSANILLTDQSCGFVDEDAMLRPIERVGEYLLIEPTFQ